MADVVISLWQALVTFVATPAYLLALVGGMLYGMLFGLLPGINVVMAATLVLPFTYYVQPELAIVFLMGLYAAGIFGGSFTSILFNVPGDPQNAATCLDGYPLARKGFAARALGTAVTCSAIGGVVGAVILATLSPVLIRVALAFGPLEYFALCFVGLSVAGSLGTRSVLKGMIAALVGVLLGTVGIAELSGVYRFTFGLPQLMSGFSFAPIIIGSFAIAEILNGMLEPEGSQTIAGTFRADLLRWAEILQMRWTIIRCALVGTLIGILPGAGATVASFVGYSMEQKVARNGRLFGTGVLAGVAAPETANNAAGMGTFVPLLTLGVPGGAVAAVFYSMFQIHGLQPGPLLFVNSKGLVYLLFVAGLLANLLILPLGRLEARWVAHLIRLPAHILYPVIFVLCTIGAFAEGNNMFSVYVMLAFGVIGYGMHRYGFPVAAMVLGLILGPLLESSLIRSVILFESRPAHLLERPVGLGLLLVGILFLLAPALPARRPREAATPLAAAK